MKFEDILVEKRGRIVCVTLNRPERMNAISVQTSAELLQVLQEYRDDPEQWVMIFTGAGSKSFCSGMYVTEAAHKTQEKGKTEGYTIFKPWTDMMQSIRKPFLCAVNGYMLVGLQLNIPLWSSGYRYGLVAEAERDRELAALRPGNSRFFFHFDKDCL